MKVINNIISNIWRIIHVISHVYYWVLDHLGISLLLTLIGTIFSCVIKRIFSKPKLEVSIYDKKMTNDSNYKVYLRILNNSNYNGVFKLSKLIIYQSDNRRNRIIFKNNRPKNSNNNILISCSNEYGVTDIFHPSILDFNTINAQDNEKDFWTHTNSFEFFVFINIDFLLGIRSISEIPYINIPRKSQFKHAFYFKFIFKVKGNLRPYTYVYKVDKYEISHLINAKNSEYTEYNAKRRAKFKEQLKKNGIK